MLNKKLNRAAEKKLNAFLYHKSARFLSSLLLNHILHKPLWLGKKTKWEKGEKNLIKPDIWF